MTYVTTADGVRLFCRSWGAGPAVVCCHGWAMNSDAWQGLLATLADAGFQAIAYDRRGHGRSDDPGRGYDLETLAGDLGAVLEAFDVEGATLVGHSMGAQEIVRYVTRHGGGRAGRLVMVAPALPFPAITPDNPGGYVDPASTAAMRAAIIADYAGFLAQAGPPAFGAKTSPAQVEHLLRTMLLTSVQAAIETSANLAAADLREELPKVKLPTLILHGDADNMVPIAKTSERVLALVPGSRLKLYADGLHPILVSHFGELAADIAAFVEETSKTAVAA
jgi:pimeloyl-ACP methyl ester carboxylesterase